MSDKKRPPVVQIQGNMFWNPRYTETCTCPKCKKEGTGAYRLPKRTEGETMKQWVDGLTVIQKEVVTEKLKPLLDIVEAGLSMTDAEFDEYLEGIDYSPHA